VTDRVSKNPVAVLNRSLHAAFWHIRLQLIFRVISSGFHSEMPGIGNSMAHTCLHTPPFNRDVFSII
jgi:hypothetical protein